jgi:hypothetical protein
MVKRATAGQLVLCGRRYRAQMNASPQEPPASPFAAIYDATADSMRAEFNRLRASLTHSGTRGDAA